MGSETFHIYESGVGCLNVPTSPAQIASQATRAMHPATLNSLNSLLAQALDSPMQVLAPFSFITKGDLCRRVGRDLLCLARVSNSCDKGDGHKPQAMQHCGLCTSCLFRRLSIHAAGLSTDPTNYRDVHTRRHGRYEIAALEHHADDLCRVTRFEDLLALDPDVRFALDPPTGLPLTPDAAKAELVAMYRRYGEENPSLPWSGAPHASISAIYATSHGGGP